MDIKKIDIPTKPGVYMMKNKEQDIIYIGKAKNLKNRVSSYFTGSHDTKTMELIKNVANIDFFICTTELEAFILENNLIKKHTPKYNILLKDQKTYPYLKITKEEYPQVLVVRKVTDDAYYFGPFPNINMKDVLRDIKKVFKIHDSKVNLETIDGIEKVKYHINLYNGPDYYKIPEVKKEYRENINHLLSFLENRDVSVLKYLEKRMAEFSENLEFERAIIERDRIHTLKKILNYQITESTRKNDEDIFVYSEDKKKIFLCVLSVRLGKLINKNFEVINKSLSDDILDNLISLYYSEKIPPRKIILDNIYKDKKEMLQDYFKKDKKKNITFTFPLKGRLYKLLNLAKINLEQEIKRYYNENSLNKEELENLKTMLHLPNYPRWIECYDISNIQGSDNVAAGVAFINGKSAPKLYRRYKIKTVSGIDDYSSMKEVVLRRLNYSPYPDLILLDGGKNHVKVVRDALKEENIDISIFGMVKDDKHRTRDLCDDITEFGLNKNENLFKLITRFQDEVHRFAITYHKKLRSKRVLKSKLDDIEGIGPKRKKLLLSKFKSIAKVFEADIDDLCEIVPLKIAKVIKNVENEK